MRRFNSPTDIPVEHVFVPAAPNRYLQYSNFDENYLITVVCPQAAKKGVAYEIQVRSTSDYEIIRSKTFPRLETDYFVVRYKLGLIVQAFGTNSVRYFNAVLLIFKYLNMKTLFVFILQLVGH